MKRVFITVFLALLTVAGPAQTVRKRNAVAGLRFGF